MNLYPHQQAALEATDTENRVAYFLDMGLGKTFVGSEKMCQMGSRLNLLICQKSKIQDWFDHFKINYQQVWIFDLTKPKEFTTFQRWATAEPPAKAIGAVVVGVINYELAWRRKELLKLKDFTLMLDESSLIQNKQAKQTKFILKLQAANVILLSGTPCSGKYENLWTQAHLLGWPISEALYNRQYVNWKLIDAGGMMVRTVDKASPYKNIERLKSKLRQNGAVFMKTDEVMNLPDQTFIETRVPASKEYKKFMRNGIINFSVSEEAVELVGDTVLTKRLYARQLCGIYSKAKLDAFRDLVQSTQDRLIVFYNFTAELHQLYSLDCVIDRPQSVVNGSFKNLGAYEDCDNSITFIQYQAGALGLNLQKANRIIYYSPPERCELWMQSQKRIHRIGQQKPCFYYKMICTGTIEENIYAALERGEDFTDELFKEVDKNEMA